MNKFKILMAILGLSGIVMISSCGKDQALHDPDQTEKYTIERRDATATAYKGISVANGLFVAETNNDLKDFLDYLEKSERDQDLSSALYSSIGLDRATRTSLEYYTDHPGAYKFEEDFSFTSKRKIEEDALFKKLGRDEDVFSIISRPYLKTILNSYDAFKVGNRIIRELDEAHYVIVHNNDMNTYERIKTLPIEQLHTDHNVSFAGLDEVLYDASDPANVKDVLIQKVDVKFFKNSSGRYDITNQSVIEFEEHYPGYEWRYADNSVSYGIVPDRDFAEGETVNLRIVKSDTPVYTGGGGNIFDDIIVTTKRDQRCDWTTEQLLTTIKLTDNTFFFNPDISFLGQVNSNNRYYTLTFPGEDNTEYSGQSLVIKKFTGFPRSVNVEFCVNFPAELGYPEPIVCCRAFEIYVGECEEIGENTDEEDYPLSNGKTVTIDGLIWVNTSGAFDWATPGEVGARTKIRGGGILNITAKIRGRYVDKDEACEIYTINTSSSRLTDDQTAVNYGHEGARKFPGELESKHTFEYNGQIFELPIGDDWLILE